MKNIDKISTDITLWSKRSIKKIVEKQKEAANKILSDVKVLAPAKSGEYISSIKVSDTINENGIIKTSIYTDLTSVVHSGKRYAIGRMIEHGTGIYALEPHIGTSPTFTKSGYQYWFVPCTSINRAIGRKITIDGKDFYIVYAQPPKPHFLPALNSNKEYYKKKIRESFKK